MIRTSCIFETVTDTNTKPLERSKETRQIFVGSIDYNISATNSSPTAIKGIYPLKHKRCDIARGFTRRARRKELSDASRRRVITECLKPSQSQVRIGSL